MAVKVRVQNFQSIEDATVVVDGLTVVTGPNNSGKSALMRAIRGVFTNAPGGPLVRHGCAHLTVTLTFDDSTEIVWEKGWEKPGRKGKTVNRYTINGMQIAGVGRGVPPEVEALGVREISAASDRIWPQIAQQFDGTLFLVNRPGSAVAEALSDVERVGKLASALKASEKDRRAVNSELKVRRKDLLAHEERVQHYKGFEEVESLGDSLHLSANHLRSQKTEIMEVEGLEVQHRNTSTEAARYASFDSIVLPDPSRVQKLARGIEKVTAYRQQHANAHQQAGLLTSFEALAIPFPTALKKQGEQLVALAELSEQWSELSAVSRRFESFASLEIPDSERLQKLGLSLGTVTDLRDRYSAALSNAEGLDAEMDDLAQKLAAAETEVKRLLGDRGECPTCKTIHTGVTHETNATQQPPRV